MLDVTNATSERFMIIPRQKAHDILNARQCEGVSVFATYPTTNGTRLIPQGLRRTLAIPHRKEPRYFNAPDECMKPKILLIIHTSLLKKLTAPEIFTDTVTILLHVIPEVTTYELLQLRVFFRVNGLAPFI